MTATQLSTAFAALALTYAAASPAQVVINEIDYDQSGGNTAEFLELYNAGSSAVNLDNYTVELVNGNGGGAAVYDTIDLPNVSLAAGDYYVICANAATVPNCDLDDGPNTDFIQNGAPDAIGLRLSGTLVDAVSYEGNTGSPYTEGTGASAADGNANFTAISRLPDGTDTDNNNADFSLRCNSPGFANVSGNTTCLDPAAAPTISADDIFDFEGTGGTTTFSVEVVLSAPAPTGGIAIPYTTADGTATVADGDYLAATGTLTIAAGDSSGFIDLTVNADSTTEADEEFFLDLGPASAGRLRVRRVTVFVDNDDIPTVSIADASVVEGNVGNTAMVFTATLSEPSASDCRFGVEIFGTPPGTPATPDVDFVNATARVTIPAMQTEATFEVQVIGDTLPEGDEQFVVSTFGEPFDCDIESASAVGTIIDDDVPITVSIDDVTLPEGDAGLTAFQFTLSLSAPAVAPLQYRVYTEDDTAVAPGDYTAIPFATPLFVNFAVGETEQPVVIQVNGDSAVEADETFRVQVIAGGAVAPEGLPPTLATGTGTILNDDVERILTIADASVVEGTGAGSTVANFTVTLSAEPAAGNPVTVNYATASGTATSGTDFTATSGTLTFLNGGALTQDIAVPITRDVIDEEDEDFTLSLSAPANATLGSPAVATGTIQDDDTATPSVGNVTLAEGNSGTTAFVFTVTLSTPAATVRNYAAYTVDGSAGAPGDYTAISAATPAGVIFAAGDVEETVTVLVNGDSTVEANENFQLLLVFPGNGAPEGNGPPVLATGTATISNDDSATVAISGSSGPEGNAGTTPRPFTVTLSNPVDGTVSVNFASADGSATVADNDYQAASGTVTFASLSTTDQTVNVNVVGDLEVEPDQGFTVNLSNLVAPAGVTLGTASATGTIVNDDATSFSISGASVVEGTGGNTTLVYTVSSSAPAKDPVSVQYATTGGTATAGSDYTAASGTVTFSGGQTSQTIAVTVIGDNVVEPDETVIVTLSNPNGGTIATASATGTIVNDDAASLSIADVALPEGTPGLATAPEGAGGLTPFVFTVTTSNPSVTPITVNFQTADGSALAPPDYIAGAGSVTIPALATTGTLTVQVVPDTMIEPNETFLVNLSGAVGATIADAQAVGTIIGDDLLAPIPTLGEHGRWLLMLLIASLGAFVLARRR